MGKRSERRVEVILRQEVPHLGRAGDVVRVRPGFARNYLLRKGLAVEATAAARAQLEQERERARRRAERARQEAAARAEAVRGKELTFRVRAMEDGRLFGSVSAADIAAALAEQGASVARDDIRLEEPIKAVGVYTVEVRTHPEVEPVPVKVWVIQET